MEKEKEYFGYLYQQFIEAKAKTQNMGQNLPQFATEFKSWLEERYQQAEIYRGFLRELNLDFDNVFCAEVSKGTYDSVVLNKTKTSLITPYVENHHEYKNLIMPLTSIVTASGEIMRERITQPVVIDNFSHFMTQNSYTSLHLENWGSLHLNNIPIIVGVYGNKFDKDRETKLKLIRDFRKELDGNIVFLHNETKEDTYVSIVATKRLTKN